MYALKILAISIFAIAMPTTVAADPSIKMREKNFFLVQGHLPGRELSTYFIVDTGASDTVLLDWFTNESKIPLKNDSEDGTDSGGNTFRVKKTEATKLAFGGWVRDFAFIHVVPSPGPFNKFGVGGILSPQTMFSDRDLLIDFRNKQLVFGAEARSKIEELQPLDILGIRPCASNDKNRYLVEAKFNNTRGIFYLDSGGRRAALTPNFAKKAGIVGTKFDERFGVGGQRNVITVNDVSFEISSIVTKLNVDIEESGVSCPTADGKIGIDFMKNYAWYFSSDRKQLKLFY